MFLWRLNFLFTFLACRVRVFLCRSAYEALVPRLRLTGCGYMQAGFPNIIRKILSDKTNCLLKRTRMIHSCLHIAAVVYRAVFPSCLSSVCISINQFLFYEYFVFFLFLSLVVSLCVSVFLRLSISNLFSVLFCFLICLVFNWNLILSRFHFKVIESF